VDGTVAHEWWHQIDAHFQARRYRESIEFRREIGHYFGVETIEHATAVQANAPDAWKAAHERVAGEVSSYGGTNPKEATAELFKLWWCNVGEPTPVVRLFGQLLARYFGVTEDR
jgi:hypothetical protein